MTRGITDNSIVHISIFSNSQLMSVINNNNSMASDDVYLHGADVSCEPFITNINGPPGPFMTT